MSPAVGSEGQARVRETCQVRSQPRTGLTTPPHYQSFLRCEPGSQDMLEKEGERKGRELEGKGKEREERGGREEGRRGSGRGRRRERGENRLA